MLPSVPTLALTCLLLLAAGYVVLALLTLVPRFRGIANETWPILLTETLIVGLAAGAIWIGGVVLSLALLALLARCVWEAATVTRMRHRQARLSPRAIAAGAVLLAIVLGFLPILVAILVSAGLVLAALFSPVNHRIPRTHDLRLLRELALFPIAPLLVFVAAGLHGSHGAWLLVAFIFVETFDSYALAGGRLFGRTRAFPSLSPRKTVEGLAFGSGALMLTAALAAPVFGAPLLGSVAVALISGGLAVAGDLAASALKRRAGVKDYPRVLPHQGGLLDITDAWITAGAGLVAIAAITGLA